MYFFKVIVSILLMSPIYALAQNNFVVVVPKESKIKKLSKNYISKLFLSKIKSYSNGEKAIPIEISDKESRENFYKIMTNKNEKQLLKYWAKMVFTGRGIPPKKVKKESDILDFLKNNKNAITYIQKKYLHKDLRIVWELK